MYMSHKQNVKINHNQPGGIYLIRENITSQIVDQTMIYLVSRLSFTTVCNYTPY